MLYLYNQIVNFKVKLEQSFYSKDVNNYQEVNINLKNNF
jgi:hypothetical protein